MSRRPSNGTQVRRYNATQLSHLRRSQTCSMQRIGQSAPNACVIHAHPLLQGQMLPGVQQLLQSSILSSSLSQPILKRASLICFIRDHGPKVLVLLLESDQGFTMFDRNTHKPPFLLANQKLSPRRRTFKPTNTCKNN